MDPDELAKETAVVEARLAEREAAVAEHKQRRREEGLQQEATGAGRRLSRYRLLQKEQHSLKKEEAAVVAAASAEGRDTDRSAISGRLGGAPRPSLLLPAGEGDARPRASARVASQGKRPAELGEQPGPRKRGGRGAGDS